MTIRWLFEPENSGLVGGLGLLVGAGGSILTIVAFAITIWQLIRTASANRAVASAVQALKSRVAAYDVVSELARADSALKETQRHLISGNWLHVLDSLSEARVSVVRLSELPSSLDDAHRSSLSEMSNSIENSNKRIRSALSKGSKMPDQASLLHSTGEFQMTITKLSLKVERQI